MSSRAPSQQVSILLETLTRNLKESIVFSLSDEDRENYGRDWTQFSVPNPPVVLFPKSTSQVSSILKLCNAMDLEVVPSGGRTGLAGGAVAANAEIVLSLQKMNRIHEIDPFSRTVRVEAGAITEAVHEHCAASKLQWPVDFASKGSSQIGGNLATNAGGLRVIRYGHTRNWVQSIEVVLMSGEVVELNGPLEKNNAGYDLRHLLIGSEGTLGIITQATLRLTASRPECELIFLGASTMQDVLKILNQLRSVPGIQIQAFECLTRACLESVCSHRAIEEPFERASDFYVLCEYERHESLGLREEIESSLVQLLEKGIARDGALAQSSADSKKFWAYREGITESLRARGQIYKNDLAVPISKLEAFTSTLLEMAPTLYPQCELFVFGHLGDGNLHVNVLRGPHLDSDSFVEMCEQANTPLFKLIQSLQGSIAAEHGIGLLKRDFLNFSRSPLEIEILRGIKKVFDPKGLLNPGKIFRKAP